MSAPTIIPVRRVPVTRARVRLTGRRRRILRAVHVAVGVGWLGLACAMLTLGLSATCCCAAATLISVDKPWGRIRKEQR